VEEKKYLSKFLKCTRYITTIRIFEGCYVQVEKKKISENSFVAIRENS
jgi:hypothetical protein